MIHHFNTDEADKYGIVAAVILYNLKFWIYKNSANHKHFYDGRTWTYNSAEAFTAIFPYLSTWQIRHALEKLVRAGVLLKGNYNKSKYDRTLWYSFLDEETVLKGSQPILQKPQMEIEDTANGNCKNHQPIPDNITYKKPDNTLDSSQPNLSKADARKRGFQLLTKNGISQKKAQCLVYEILTPLSSIEEAIINGLSKQKYEKGFVLGPGYIVAALDGARKEGKTVSNTKNSKRLKQEINRLTRAKTQKPLSQSEFNKEKKRQLALLAAS